MSDFTSWEDLDFWRSKEWEDVQIRLDNLESQRYYFNPNRSDLFSSLDITPFDKVRVAIIGQDPYPNPQYATGLAFSTPKDCINSKEYPFPPTLVNIFRELHNDLHYEWFDKEGKRSIFPKSGNLEPWAEQGVLLWNTIPTCLQFLSLSHLHWTQWRSLTVEIVSRLNKKGICFVLCGSIARELKEYVDEKYSDLIEVSHPSPRGFCAGEHPFSGSRMFSRVNSFLSKDKLEPIDWKL